MALIPEMEWNDFCLLASDEVRELKSVIITHEGNHLFTAIIPPQNGGMTITDNIKTKAEYLGVQGNSVGGKEPANAGV